MKINRKLYLVLSALALVGLTVYGCKKKEKEGGEEKKTEAMEAMETMEAMVDEMAPEAMADAMKDSMEAMDATAAAPKPADGESLTFTKKYPGVGSVRTKKQSMIMDMTFVGGGKSMKMENSETEESKEEVLAVTSNIVTKMKVTWIEKTDVQKMDGKERVKKSPLVGKTFILEMKDGKPVAMDEAGKPLEAKLAKKVLKEHKSFGKPIAMLDALPTTPIKVGDKVDVLAEAMKKDFATDQDEGRKGQTLSLEGVTFALKEIKTEGEQKLGVFDVTVRMKVEQGKGLTIVLNLKGTVTLRAQDGWPTVSAMEGPITLNGKENAGKQVMKETISYSGK